MKRHTTLTVDEDLMEKVKKKELNISEILENAIKDRLGIVEFAVELSDKCDICGRELRKATAENQNGLIWLYPDEKWICPRCLRNKVKKVIAGKNC